MKAGLGKQGPESPQSQAAGYRARSYFPTTPGLRGELESGDIQLGVQVGHLGMLQEQLDLPTHPWHTVLT